MFQQIPSENIMTEPGLSVDDEMLSPDMFSDVDTTANTTSSTSIATNEPEPTDDLPEWKGVSMNELLKGLGIFDYTEHPPICPSANHTVLFLLPFSGNGPPKPYPAHTIDGWCQGYVRMPHSAHSLYPIDQESGNRQYRNRWEIIQESLLRSFTSSQQLETAILSYNHMYAQRWDFTALHRFFTDVVDEDESKVFFDTLLPKMVQLALQLPVLITGQIPLLKRYSNECISLSQLQVASLLANAFFCTFPRRNSTNPLSEYATYPHINFTRLFSAFKESRRQWSASLMEKFKCIFHYFRRVTSKAPEGVITLERRYIPKRDCPKWDSLNQKLLPLHITSKGTIESEGAGFLQVDFANKYIGGGVLGLGCVQEEIRFVICPELMVAMLVTEVLDDTEALIVTGVERYSYYEGYSSNFKWTGDYVDETPRDSSGRRMTSVVAIDALFFRQPTTQFSMDCIVRELNKAYVGFVGCESQRDNLPAIATGNWGCGAFRGNPKLKVLLQLMAAAAARRGMIYFTFGDIKLRDEVATMYWHLVEQNVDIARIFCMLSQYQKSNSKNNLDFYRFLYKKSKIKPLTKYFNALNRTSFLKSSENRLNSNVTSTENRDSLCNNNSNQTIYNINYTTERCAYVKQESSAEENRIETWLANLDENDLISDKELEAEDPDCGTNKQEDDNHTCNIVCQNKIESSLATVKKKKQSIWKMLEKKAPIKSTETRVSALDALSVKDPEVTVETDNKKKSVPLVQSQEIADITEINSAGKDNHTIILPTRPSINHRSLDKKGGQKKISDFFQRAA